MTPIVGLAIPYWLGNWFGIYPTWQTCLGQLGAAAFVLLSYYAARARVRRSAPSPAANGSGYGSWQRRALAGRSGWTAKA